MPLTVDDHDRQCCTPAPSDGADAPHLNQTLSPSLSCRHIAAQVSRQMGALSVDLPQDRG